MLMFPTLTGLPGELLLFSADIWQGSCFYVSGVSAHWFSHLYYKSVHWRFHGSVPHTMAQYSWHSWIFYEMSVEATMTAQLLHFVCLQNQDAMESRTKGCCQEGQIWISLSRDHNTLRPLCWSSRIYGWFWRNHDPWLSFMNGLGLGKYLNEFVLLRLSWRLCL